MKTRSQEKRRHARFPVKIRIRYRTTGGFFQDYAQNLSIGGIFIETDDPLPMGTRLSLEFCLPDLDSAIRTDGVVVHRIPGRRAGGSTEGGMGIQFSELDDKNRKLLEEYARVHAKSL